jgi:hypothetical protein
MLVVLLLASNGVLSWRAASAGEDADTASPSAEAVSRSARVAIGQGLDFLQRDVVKWRKEHECSTCHHGAMTVWVYLAAVSFAYADWAA